MVAAHPPCLTPAVNTELPILQPQVRFGKDCHVPLIYVSKSLADSMVQTKNHWMNDVHRTWNNGAYVYHTGRMFSTQPLSRHEAQESSNCDTGDRPVAAAIQRCSSGVGSGQTPQGTAPGKTTSTADASCWPTRSPVLSANRLHTWGFTILSVSMIH